MVGDGYGDFAEWADFAYWWSFSGGGSAINGATPSSLMRPTHIFMKHSKNASNAS